MKTKMLFVYPAWSEYSNKYYIYFYRDRISYYNGLHPLDKRILHGKSQVESKIFINKEFKLKKLSKLDRIDYNNTNATHEIISDNLHHMINGCVPYCVRINFFQSFYLNWHQKKYIIQALDFKKNILAAIFGAILGIATTLAFQKINQTNKVPSHPTINADPKKLDLSTDKMNNDNLLIDSISDNLEVSEK